MDTSIICPRFETAISLLSQRWTGLIIYQLLSGSQRFSELTEIIGISGRLLSERLKSLEAQGLITRTVYPETPVRIEYALTEKGRSLQPVMDEIQNWSQVWIDPTEKSNE
ncbi:MULTISPECIES: helix-turn-helix domain-containing protein [Planococcus]|uniref:HxlR family transcriptional regulator n=1 Tax=Planococcus kocurii TaxID=1374 RepID=A0ABM5WZP8_9BACL|nr:MULTISPECIES: helix-turn-helix domain-containing protein [Planococcus]ALS79850.1 HxlR family transcriptional regulator [Planococcus kocurii]KAA0957261.1 helix-turn-helix transcriptional regulator [Planococcus sp. ANT_H30]MDJ0331202.1 helix-turn-helix domain-containing protein [Planococcus sp. S3-L1]